MREAEQNLQRQLFAMADPSYKSFHCALMPTVDPDTVIGIRTPVLRKFAAEFAKTEDAAAFLRDLPHSYYEENNLHGFLLEKIKDYDTLIAELNRFLPHINNWATCDLISPKIFPKHREELLEQIRIWIRDEHTYTVRFAVGMLMKFYLDDAFDPAFPELVAKIRSEEYYINMMIAWYFATALAKQYDAILPYLENRRLDPWTHNKTIQKAIESRRITPEQKSLLRSLKIKQ